MSHDETFPDWVRAPNISRDPGIYELENEALARDGRLDATIAKLVAPMGRIVLDIGCGAGFWLPRWYGSERVIGVEPDARLLRMAQSRIATLPHIEVRHGSAEHLPLPDDSVDIACARFAYFFGPGAERGLVEVSRVLRPQGVFVAIDNSWRSGDFASLLQDASTGNAAMDPEETAQWWARHGAQRIEVEGGWQAASAEELERILRIEFPPDTVDRWIEQNPGRSSLTYAFAVFVWEAA